MLVVSGDCCCSMLFLIVVWLVELFSIIVDYCCVLFSVDCECSLLKVVGVCLPFFVVDGG